LILRWYVFESIRGVSVSDMYPIQVRLHFGVSGLHRTKVILLVLALLQVSSLAIFATEVSTHHHHHSHHPPTPTPAPVQPPSSYGLQSLRLDHHKKHPPRHPSTPRKAMFIYRLHPPFYLIVSINHTLNAT